MAVFTHVSAEEVAAFLCRYSVGELIALKGIAEGVQNSNFFVETTQGKFFLTLYEERVDITALPYFHSLLAHLHNAGCKVPRFIDDNDGNWLQQLAGRPACLIEFLSGVSATTPTAQQAYSVGDTLAQLHNAVEDFDGIRPNEMGADSWQSMAEKCGVDGLNSISPMLAKRVFDELDFLSVNWPRHLKSSAVHADLFPDNVLLLGNDVSGLIDFYFACTDLVAYDLAVTHAAWSFSSDGGTYLPQIGTAIVNGYTARRDLSDAIEVMPILFRGASMRFLLSRCYDWINTPANAFVTRKDPLAFLKRLDFYSKIDNPRDFLGL
jgi:homoserine kinase type II